jgi:hypothetical protein
MPTATSSRAGVARFKPVYEGGKWGMKLERRRRGAGHARPDRREGRAGRRHRPDRARCAHFDPGLPPRRADGLPIRGDDGHDRGARPRRDRAEYAGRQDHHDHQRDRRHDGKVKTNKTKTSNVYASTDAAAVVTDAQGNSYVVGTTKGDLGANLSDGDNNLFLTKVDGAGNVVWQRSLGASGSSTGAAVSARRRRQHRRRGHGHRQLNGATSTDGDMVVAKYAANGDEKFSTVVRSTGTPMPPRR